MLSSVKDNVKSNIYFFANWGILAAFLVKEPYEVAIVGDKCNSFSREITSNYLPNILLLGGKNEGSLQLMENKLIKGQTTIYVCKNKTCNLPVSTTSKAFKQIEYK